MLVEVSTDTIKPAIEIAIHRLEAGGEALLAVEVESGYALHDSPGGSYRRVGSSKRAMTSDERLRLSQRRAQARFLWFDKQPVPNTGFHTLDESIWKPLLSAEGRADPETTLEKLALLAVDECGVTRATVAGVLLCSAAPHEWLPNACITATLYGGTDRASGQLDARTIVGPLPRQVADAMTFAVRNMRVGAYNGLMNPNAVGRWLQYRDNRNDTARNDGEDFADATLKLLPEFVVDAKALADTIEPAADG